MDFTDLFKNIDIISVLGTALGVIAIYLVRTYLYKRNKRKDEIVKIEGLVLKAYTYVEKIAKEKEIKSDSKVLLFLDNFMKSYKERFEVEPPKDIGDLALDLMETLVREDNIQKNMIKNSG